MKIEGKQCIHAGGRYDSNQSYLLAKLSAELRTQVIVKNSVLSLSTD